MIDDEEHSVYILDDIAIKVGNMLEIDTPSSCDSVVVKGQDIYMIEYKNRDYQKVSSRDKREIRKKLYQSRELVLNTFWPTKDLQYIADHVHVFVVFKSMDNESVSFDKLANTLNALAGNQQEEIKCKLAKFKDTFYKEVHTISKAEFESKYMPIIFAE